MSFTYAVSPWGGLAVIPSEDKYEIILPADINGPIEHMMKD